MTSDFQVACVHPAAADEQLSACPNLAVAPPACAAADGVVATSETVNGKLQQRQEEVEELDAVSGVGGACGGDGRIPDLPE